MELTNSLSELIRAGSLDIMLNILLTSVWYIMKSKVEKNVNDVRTIKTKPLFDVTNKDAAITARTDA